jgi:uncharacterized OB-fold protein
MKGYKCSNCEKIYFEKRLFCKCGNDNFVQIDINKGKVISSLKLLVTPIGYPDKITLALLDVGSSKVFCYSEHEVREGDLVNIIDQGDKIMCLSLK